MKHFYNTYYFVYTVQQRYVYIILIGILTALIYTWYLLCEPGKGRLIISSVFPRFV